MTEYTKGEWKAIISRVTGGDFYSVVSNYHKHQFEIAKIMSMKEDKANAYLIAASPRMYEALKEARITLNVLQPKGSAILREIDEALAKASTEEG